MVIELNKKISVKPYLAKQISKLQSKELVDILSSVVKVIPAIKDEIPEVIRDKKDDYLLAYAVIGEADYLVTGDEDLLSLKEIEGVKIVNIPEFYQILNK